jgi:hypothetical protein
MILSLVDVDDIAIMSMKHFLRIFISLRVYVMKFINC